MTSPAQGPRHERKADVGAAVADRARRGRGSPVPSGDGGGTGGEDQPDDAYFDLMASVAARHWWYRARRALLAQLLDGRVAAGSTAVDVGCGTSETLDVLGSLGATTAVGTDLSPTALAHALRRSSRPAVVRSLAEAVPVRSAVASTLVSMDVIEHLDDDVAALREYRRVCRPGAVVVLSVPAYQWLWSEHDDRACHRRRYTAAMLERSVRAAGLEVERTTYVFSFLVPPAVLVRRTPLRRLFPPTDEEASSFHPAVDAVLARLATLERRWLRHRSLPFGLSVLCVARVPAACGGIGRHDRADRDHP